jgi:hypothetical protein
MVIFKEFMYWVNIPITFFQFAGEMSNSYIYKFPQNNLYFYKMIADGLREEFEDTKGAIRIRISKKNRQN